jgi:hypothetical protein
VPPCVAVPAPTFHLDREETLIHAVHSGTSSQELQYAPPMGTNKQINKQLHIFSRQWHLWLWKTKTGYVRLEFFTAVIMQNGVFWDVTPCGSRKNRRFGGTQRLLHHGDKNR